jgi:hypothetical protein
MVAGQMLSVFALVIPEGPTSRSSSSCDSYSSSPESRSTRSGSGTKSCWRLRRREWIHLNTTLTSFDSGLTMGGARSVRAAFVADVAKDRPNCRSRKRQGPGPRRLFAHVLASRSSRDNGEVVRGSGARVALRRLERLRITPHLPRRPQDRHGAVRSHVLDVRSVHRSSRELAAVAAAPGCDLLKSLTV